MPDTNVLVAAAITPRGLCGRLLDAAIEGRWEPVVSPQLLAEFQSVLTRDKFRRWLSEDEASRFVADVAVLAEVMPYRGRQGDRGLGREGSELVTADPSTTPHAANPRRARSAR